MVPPLANQAAGTTTWYPTQSLYPNTDSTRPCSILIRLSTWLGSDNWQLKKKSFVRVDRKLNSWSPESESSALLIWPPPLMKWWMLFGNTFNSCITKGTLGTIFRQLPAPPLVPTPPIFRHHETMLEPWDASRPRKIWPSFRPLTPSSHTEPTTSPNLQLPTQSYNHKTF